MLVCIPIQVYHVRKSLSSSQSQPHMPSEADHVTITIIAVGTLSFLCNCMAVTIIVIDAFDPFANGDLVFLIAAYTLPLVNALGFPLIIILRKTSLRDRFKAYLLSPVLFIRRTCQSIKAYWSGYGRIQPQEEIQSQEERQSQEEIRPQEEIQPHAKIQPKEEIQPKEIQPQEEIQLKDEIQSIEEIH